MTREPGTSNMPDRTIHISFVTPQGQPIGGAVDIDLSPQAAPGVLEPPITLRNVDASKAVDVPLPPLGVAGQLQLAVRSRSGAFEPIKQLITLRSQADDKFQVVVHRDATADGQGNAGL